MNRESGRLAVILLVGLSCAIAEETRTGVHVVIDVPPGGETYSVTFLDASDESMRVVGVRSFKSRGR